MFSVAQMFCVFEHLIRRCSDRKRVLICLSQLQSQAQVLLHVAQRHLTVGQEKSLVRIMNVTSAGKTYVANPASIIAFPFEMTV